MGKKCEQMSSLIWLMFFTVGPLLCLFGCVQWFEACSKSGLKLILRDFPYYNHMGYEGILETTRNRQFTYRWDVSVTSLAIHTTKLTKSCKLRWRKKLPHFIIHASPHMQRWNKRAAPECSWEPQTRTVIKLLLYNISWHDWHLW